MSGFTDIKQRKFKHLLKWLGNNRSVEVKQGGRHNIKVACIRTGESYPIPSSHREINKHIVKDFMEWLVRSEICTEEEFRERLK